jgi:uncharacterized protein (TIGR03067 family)
MRIAVLLLPLAGLLPAADGGPKDELAKLKGTWQAVSAEVDGRKANPVELEKTFLVIEGDRYTLQVPDAVRKGTFKIDPSKTPKQVDVTAADGPAKGKTMRGIYELKGATLRYCLAEPGKDRPTEFTGKSGSGCGLYVTKRME